MRRIQALIIGAGQAGLAMSRCLSARGLDHVVVDRSRVAERWRSARWRSLRLLTPNWQTRLPGLAYDGPDPDGYMPMPEVIALLERYARAIAAPIEEGMGVRLVERFGREFRVATSTTEWRAQSVVVATGHADVDAIPSFAATLSPAISQVPASQYREPRALTDGGVLVVGASASGIQIADELLREGRRVVVASGRHLRMPRRYRGKDILWWLDRTGILHEPASAVYDVEVSRRQPSFQLVGRDDARLDLAILQQRGAEIAGRLTDVIDGTEVVFADDLVATAAASDFKLAGLLQRIDRFVRERGMDDECGPSPEFEPIWPLFTTARRQLNLAREDIRTVIWATGFRRAYPWLKVDGVLDARGEIRHHEGISVAPGLYVLGLQFLRHRNSSFIDGVGRDASALADHLAMHVSGRAVA